jgi:class 3 adenylate cyclase
MSGSASTGATARSHVAGRLAVGLGLVAIGLGVGALALEWPFSAGPLPGRVSGALSITAGVPFAVMGALICTRRSWNRIGWLMLAAGLSNTGSNVALEYLHGHHRLARLPVAWIEPSSQVTALVALMFLLLLYPTGRLVSRRWRPVAWAAGAWGILGIIAIAVNPELADPALRNPIGLRGVTKVMNSSLTGGFLIVLLLAVLASLAVRFRRARGVERQQIKWLLYAASVAAVANLFFPLNWWTWGLLPWLAIWAIPVAVGIAILRHRLYDIDLLITRTLAYGLLTAFVTVVYLVIVVVGTGTLVGWRAKPNVLLPIVATALMAVAFQPARDRSRRLANRLVYGRRATPYEVLSAFSRGVAGASTDDSLQRMARLVVEATGAVKVTVWLRLGEGLQPQTSWPQAGPLPEPIALEGRGVEEALAATQPASLSFPVGYEEELLGALTVTVSPIEPLTPASEKLIADLATQTGLGLRFQRLKERALFARALASFLPPEVAELVEASPSALSLREEVEASILFSDIRGFSSLAERLPPRQVAEVVGRHLTAMVEVVTAHGGVLDKFAGDAVMAVFGAPRPVEDHARRALRCAAAMQRRQLVLNEAAEHEGLPTSQIGIGVNTGTVIAGTLGGAGRLDYTVLGDAVNIAQRLQSEAVGGEILAAAVTVHQAGTDRAEPVGLKQLKGRQELVDVYRIRWADISTAQPSGETAHAE